MAEQSMWPQHLCGDVLGACQRNWLRASGLDALLIRVPRGSGVPDLRLGDQMPPLAWPTWALAIGRKALDEDAALYPEPKPSELARVRPLLPFDGYERALFVARAVIKTETVDFFGLGRPMSSAERLALSDLDREALGEEPVYFIGESAAILRGRADRLADQKSTAVGFLRLARRWWGGLRGKPYSGSHPGDRAAFARDALFRAELDEAIRYAHQSTGHIFVDPRTVYRRLGIGKSLFYQRIPQATGKTWPQVRAEYAREFMESRGIEVPQDRR
jgi:hypothetical protein